MDKELRSFIDNTWCNMAIEITQTALAAQGWTAHAISVILSIVPRSVARRIVLDDSTMPLMSLWSILRWEKTVAVCGLEALGADLWLLQRDLDCILSTKVNEQVF